MSNTKPTSGRKLKPAVPTPFIRVKDSVFDKTGRNIIGYGYSLRNINTAVMVTHRVNVHKRLVKALRVALDWQESNSGQSWLDMRAKLAKVLALAERE